MPHVELWGSGRQTGKSAGQWESVVLQNIASNFGSQKPCGEPGTSGMQTQPSAIAELQIADLQSESFMHGSAGNSGAIIYENITIHT